MIDQTDWRERFPLLHVGTSCFADVDSDAGDNIDEYAVTKEVETLVRATYIQLRCMLGPFK